MRSAVLVMAGILWLAVASYATVNVTSPTAGSTTSSSVHVTGNATMSGTVTTMQIYVDNVKLYQKSGSSIDTYLTLSSGSHSLVMQSWNSSGQYSKSASISFKVGTTTTTTSTAPSTATVYSNIDQMTGWQDCGACAGAGGNGTVVPYSITQFLSSPSMDAKSAQFWIGSGTPYSDALWWKQLGANANVSHFVYDTYFYYTDATAPQSLEFDLNQSVGGYKYIFGTQCSIRGDHSWDIWDNVNLKWVSTGIACPAPPTYKWNHLVWEFERVNGKLHFIAITLNGVKNYVNRYYAPRASSAKELNVAFQMDGNYAGKSYKVFLDKVTLKAW